MTDDRMHDDRVADALTAHVDAIGAYGMSAGVARRGTHPRFAACGIDARNPDLPMTSTGTFRVASVTKTFTAAIVLELVDRGRLDLDDTIDRWFPAFPHAAQMPVRSLLVHTAGTPDMTFDAFDDYIALILTDLERRFTPAEVIDIMGALPPFAVPGEMYRYSNTDYQLLGAISEQVSGLSFAELLRGFTTRLGLDATTYSDHVPTDLKHGWFDIGAVGAADATSQRDQDTNDFPNTALITTAYAGGGLTSSLADLLAWGDALYLGDALSPSMREQMLASLTVQDPESLRWHGFGIVGYGDRAADGSWPAYGHAGNIVGSSAFVASFPGSGTTVAIHANVQEVGGDAFVDLAFDLERITT